MRTPAALCSGFLRVQLLLGAWLMPVALEPLPLPSDWRDPRQEELRGSGAAGEKRTAILCLSP